MKQPKQSLKAVLLLLAVVGSCYPAYAEEFKEYQIRVMRPRFFNKIGRYELGAQFTAVMNDSFVYSYLGTGILGYHFSNTMAIELQGSVGFSLDKEEKRVLKDEFDVRTQIFRTFYSFEGALQYTPIYGKWQVPSGDVIYFDTYLHFGGGLTGINWQYSDFCVATKVDPNAGETPIPADTTISYPTIVVGLGQRYFVTKRTAIKWDIRNHSMIYNLGDTACNPEVDESSGTDIHHNITMQIGYSKFF